MEEVTFQPHLGRFEDDYKGFNNLGYLSLAKVLKVHNKFNTADVMLVRTNDIVSSSEINEGRFGARIGTPSAHFDRTLMATSGVIEPIQEGQLVVLAFLDGMKSQPIIICSFHDTYSPQTNVLPNIYPLNPTSSSEELREALKYLRVLPSQFYTRIDGVGGVEISHPSKSFLKMDNGMIDTVDDSHEGFDHKDLEEKDSITFQSRTGRTEEALLPVNILFSHRSSFMDEATTWTKFFLSAEGMFRATRDNNDGKLTYNELTPEGEYVVRRQLDSPEHGEGEDNTEVRLGTDGSYKIIRDKQGVQTIVDIDAEGKVTISNPNTSVTVDTNKVDVVTNGNINLTGSGVNIQGAVNIQGTLTLNGVSVATVDQLHDHE